MNYTEPRYSQDLEDRFLEKGYVKIAAEDREALNEIRTWTVDVAARTLDLSEPDNHDVFLNGIHEKVSSSQLNEFRLKVIQQLSSFSEFQNTYYRCGRSAVEALAGNDLAVQKNIALSIQLPGDESSILPLHSDTWGSECSPFEMVLWIPLVDCATTKSMFILPLQADQKWRQRVSEFESKGLEALYTAVEPELEWIDIKFGEVLLFTPTVMHGNRVNREESTRWSFNLRFKSLFTPYSNKKLGEYFMPLKMRPLTKIGLEFEMPVKT